MENLDIDQVAAYLSRDAREVGKMASRGNLPGRRVNGEWRFARAEIQRWIENRLHECTEAELEALESANAGEHPEPLLAGLLTPATVEVPILATTRASLMRELVRLAERSWQVYDAEAVREAIEQRETQGSTALAGGVAVPHPHRPLPSSVLGDSVVAFARTSRGIPFGGPGDGLTDLFFLVLSSDAATHLRILARLGRLMLRDGLIDALRAAETADEAHELLIAAEQELLVS
jgi:nitrogen PTS system EIIA component